MKRTIKLTLVLFAAAALAAEPGDIQMRTALAGGPLQGLLPSGSATFKARPARGSMALTVEVEDIGLPAGTTLEVLINGQPAGQMRLSGLPARGAELELNSNDGQRPPSVKPGDVIQVRSGSAVLVSGVMQSTALMQSINSPSSQTPVQSPASASAASPVTLLRTPLAGGSIAGIRPSGHLEFREDTSRGAMRIHVEVEDVNLPAGTVLNVEVENRVVATLRLGANGFAEVELDGRSGDFVNRLRAGAGVRVTSPAGAILSGGLQNAIPASISARSSSAASTGGSSASSTSDSRMRSPLAGGSVGGMQPSGHVEFRTDRGDRKLNVEVEDVNLPAGTLVDVWLGDRKIGQIRIGPAPMRGGELELNSKDGATVPDVKSGDQITVRTSSAGVLVSGVVQSFSFASVPPPPSGTSSSASNSNGTGSQNTGGDDRGRGGNNPEPGDDRGRGGDNSGGGSGSSGGSGKGGSGGGGKDDPPGHK